MCEALPHSAYTTPFSALHIRKFAVGTCNRVLSCICEEILFIWKQTFLTCEQLFYLWNFLFLTVFLFVIVVAVIGHRIRHEFFERRRTANNLTQGVRTEFSYKRLSCLYDEMEPNTCWILQVSTGTKKWIWQICSCSRKMRCCGWTFIIRKNWSIRKNYFIFSWWKQWKLMQRWSYWDRSEPWRWERIPNTLQIPYLRHFINKVC